MGLAVKDSYIKSLNSDSCEARTRVSLVQNGEYVNVKASCTETSSNVLKTKIKESTLLHDMRTF